MTPEQENLRQKHELEYIRKLVQKDTRESLAENLPKPPVDGGVDMVRKLVGTMRFIKAGTLGMEVATASVYDDIMTEANVWLEQQEGRGE